MMQKYGLQQEKLNMARDIVQSGVELRQTRTLNI